MKFISEVSGEEHNDIEYVFRCLLHSDAFEYCAVLDVVRMYFDRLPRLKYPALVNLVLKTIVLLIQCG